MSLSVLHSIAELRQAVSARRHAGDAIGLVPTMGALHAGHGRLIENAVRENPCTVVSIFVNPIQFNDARDFERYPRDLSTDVEFCRALGGRLVFAPSTEEMYPEPSKTSVDVHEVTDHLCGKFRPGHFRGVATVVFKLFEIVQPDRAYFGEKDAQQLAVIRRMVRDLNVPVEIVGVPTVREHDGLALSSRNQLLTADQRNIAPRLYQALLAAQRAVVAGARDSKAVLHDALDVLAAPEIRVEYFEVVDVDSMQPVTEIRGEVRIAAAIWLGSTRLIDNIAALR